MILLGYILIEIPSQRSGEQGLGSIGKEERISIHRVLLRGPWRASEDLAVNLWGPLRMSVDLAASLSLLLAKVSRERPRLRLEKLCKAAANSLSQRGSHISKLPAPRNKASTMGGGAAAGSSVKDGEVGAKLIWSSKTDTPTQWSIKQS